MLQYNNHIFSSIKEFAIKYSLHYGNTCRRIRYGWTLAECIDPTKRKRPPSKTRKITIEGRVFQSLKKAAKTYHISASNLQNRLHLGWSPEEAVGIKKRPKKKTSGISCEYLGQSFSSKRERNKFFKVDHLCEDIIEKRIKRGWTERQAANLDPPPHRFRNIDGSKRTGGWRENEKIGERLYPKAAKGEYRLYVITNSINSREYVGITITNLDVRLRGHRRESLAKNSQGKLHRAMRKHGVDNFEIHLIRNDAKNFKELAEQEVNEIEKRQSLTKGYNVSKGGDIGSCIPVNINGEEFASRSSAAEYYGIDIGVFNLRLSRLGWTPEQAAEIENRPKPYKAETWVNGNYFPSFKAACKHFCVNYQTTWKRKNDGWTNEQAFNLAPPPKSFEKSKAKKINVRRKQFSSQAKMAAYLEISPAVVTKRRKEGKSYEWIFDYFSTKN